MTVYAGGRHAWELYNADRTAAGGHAMIPQPRENGARRSREVCIYYQGYRAVDTVKEQLAAYVQLKADMMTGAG